MKLKTYLMDTGQLEDDVYTPFEITPPSWLFRRAKETSQSANPKEDSRAFEDQKIPMSHTILRHAARNGLNIHKYCGDRSLSYAEDTDTNIISYEFSDGSTLHLRKNYGERK